MDSKLKRVEFGGVVQLQILKVGVYAIVILSPEPFSLVLVMGVRFPTPIELSFGFTLNGVGGLIALDRGIDLEALRKGMAEHVIDRMLFPDDPVSEAPKLLDQVAHVFPPRSGAFVFGPIAELGWGSQAKFVEVKIGVVLALPEFLFVILGSLRVRVPTKEMPITDIRADVYIAITDDHLEMYARMRDSKIGEIKISGDLGLYIGWTKGGVVRAGARRLPPGVRAAHGRDAAPQGPQAHQDRDLARRSAEDPDPGVLRAHRGQRAARRPRRPVGGLQGRERSRVAAARHALRLVAALPVQGVD